MGHLTYRRSIKRLDQPVPPAAAGIVATDRLQDILEIERGDLAQFDGSLQPSQLLELIGAMVGLGRRGVGINQGCVAASR